MVRAKFVVESVQDFGNFRRVKLRAVYRSQPGSENSSFWSATPSGELEMQIDNPGAWGLFVPQREIYLDFHPAPAEEDAA